VLPGAVAGPGVRNENPEVQNAIVVPAFWGARVPQFELKLPD
jgi:hypothetical protein